MVEGRKDALSDHQRSALEAITILIIAIFLKTQPSQEVDVTSFSLLMWKTAGVGGGGVRDFEGTMK